MKFFGKLIIVELVYRDFVFDKCLLKVKKNSEQDVYSFCLAFTGGVSRYFRPPFFYDSNPSRHLINRLKYFRIHFRVP